MKCYAYFWEVCHLALWQDYHICGHWQGQTKAFYKEEECQANPANQGSSGTAWKEKNLSGRSHMGPVTASNSCTTLSDQFGLDKDRGCMYEPNWATLPEASKVRYELAQYKCKKSCVSRCRCKKDAFKCTALCMCEGECSQNWHYSYL